MQDKLDRLNELGLDISEYFKAKGIKKVMLIGTVDEINWMNRILSEAAWKVEVTSLEMADIVITMPSVNFEEIEKSICEKKLLEVFSYDEMIDRICANVKCIKNK